ncbi:MAG: hypothetical protein RIA64_14700 [Rhodospirillales bacterium]
MTRRLDAAGVAEELLAIPGLSRPELIARWEKAHHRPPPKGISRRLLEYSAAYQVQVKAFGGLKPAILDGRQAEDVTVYRMRRLPALSFDWQKQAELLENLG